MLTELTVIFPYLRCTRLTETGVLLDPTRESAQLAISELVAACRTLPDFHTFQIVCLLIIQPHMACWCGGKCSKSIPWGMSQSDRSLREQAKGMKDFAIGCLKKPGMGCLEGGGRKRTTLRIIQFTLGSHSEVVEECEV